MTKEVCQLIGYQHKHSALKTGPEKLHYRNYMLVIMLTYPLFYSYILISETSKTYKDDTQCMQILTFIHGLKYLKKKLIDTWTSNILLPIYATILQLMEIICIFQYPKCECVCLL